MLGTGGKVTRYSCVTHVFCLWLIHFLVMELIFFPEMTARSIEYHDAVITWKHSPRYWPFVRGIHQSPVNSPHKTQWRGALMSSLICAWINVSSSSSNFISRRIQQNTFHMHNIYKIISQMYSSGGCQRRCGSSSWQPLFQQWYSWREAGC